jgi:menaquinone reductase, molybdopterin-binding-like subunit
MADLGRRGFLGAAGALAGAAACRTSQASKDPYAATKPPVPLERGTRPGEERSVLTTCRLCRAGCGLRVRVVDGRAVKVEGNPESPVNRGGGCARGQAGVQLLYHPDRVRAPRRRVGPRGENRWQEISWDEAIAGLADELAKARFVGEPQSVVLLDGEYAGETHALWTRFMAAFGSPNHVGHGCDGRTQVAQAVRRLTGAAGVASYDFEHSACVLLVGTGALESSAHAIGLACAMGRTPRPRVFCASPRLPRMATFVDEWLDVAPGCATVFLLAVAHVLVRDNLADEAALQKAAGFLPSMDESGRQPGLRARLLAELSPESVASVTGVSAERISRVAHALAGQRPSVVSVDEEPVDLGTAAAAILVNALLGSLDVPGGMRLDRGGAFAFQPLQPDAAAVAGLAATPLDGRARSDFADARLLAIPQAILASKPYATKVLLQSYSNPVFSKPAGKIWREAIAKVPFVVSFSPFFDESTAGADLLLPDHTFFERWEVFESGASLGLVQPVVRPIGKTLSTGEVILRLARELGESVARAFPWKTMREVAVEGLSAATKTAEPSLLDDLQSKGVVQRTPDTKPAVVVDVQSISWAPPSVPSDSVRFPFAVVPFRGSGYAEGGFRQLAWIAELPAVANPRGQRIEISPDDARWLGIEQGDDVLVESSFGVLPALVEVSTTVRPGVLGLPLGREEAMGLLGGFVDEASGHWLASATRAQIRKVG